MQPKGKSLGKDDLPYTQLIDEGDGSYSVLYMADEPGEYDINVKLDGKHIKDSPFNAVIRRGASAAHCAIKFPHDKTILVGKPETFVIEARDETGQRLSEGGDVFRVILDSGGADVATTSQQDNNDGTYLQTFTCPVAGTYTVDVSIGDESIAGSPFTFKAKKGLISAELSSASGIVTHDALPSNC